MKPINGYFEKLEPKIKGYQSKTCKNQKCEISEN